MVLLRIRYFLEVSKTLNFTVAAQNMHTSQPSFSRQISLLEDEVGVPLLVRNNRSVALTEAGDMFVREFSPLISQMDEALKSIHQKFPCKKELRVGIFQPLLLAPFKDMLDALQSHYEAYNVILFREKAAELRKKFMNGELDLLLINNVIDLDLPDARCCVVGSDPAAVICGAKLDISDNTPPDFSDFNNKKLLCLDEELAPGLKNGYMDLSKRLGITPSVTVVCNDLIWNIATNYSEDGFSFHSLQLTDSEKQIQFHPIPKEIFEFSMKALWSKKCSINLNQFFADRYDLKSK